MVGAAAFVTGALVLVTGAALGERSTVVAGAAVGVTGTASSTLRLVTSIVLLQRADAPPSVQF